MSGLSDLKKFDRRQLFRLFVGGMLQKKYNGWRGFEENVPGSTQAMLNGYLYMLENFDLSKGVSCHYIRMLHRICTFSVSHKVKNFASGDLRYLKAGNKLHASTTSIESLKEIFEYRARDGKQIFYDKGLRFPAKDLNPYKVYKILTKRKVLIFKPWFPNLKRETLDFLEHKGTLSEFYQAKAMVQIEFAKKTEEIVSRFNSKFLSDLTPDQTIKMIARFIQEIHILHPFPDANCRTFTLLANHLLLYKKLPCTLLSNPRLDYSYSYQEYAHEIKKGIRSTQQLLKNPEMTLYNYSIRSASEKDLSEFVTMSEGFVNALNKYQLEE